MSPKKRNQFQSVFFWHDLAFLMKVSYLGTYLEDSGGVPKFPKSGYPQIVPGQTILGLKEPERTWIFKGSFPAILAKFRGRPRRAAEVPMKLLPAKAKLLHSVTSAGCRLTLQVSSSRKKMILDSITQYNNQRERSGTYYEIWGQYLDHFASLARDEHPAQKKLDLRCELHRQNPGFCPIAAQLRLQFITNVADPG